MYLYIYMHTLLQVSPQFCDDLTDNGNHLRANPRRKNLHQKPLQEVRELFPETVRKSAIKRNPLTFKQNRELDKCSVNDPCPVWCSQEISLYPSTFAPRSKWRVDRSESNNSDSVADEEEAKNDDQLDEGGDLLDVRGYHGDQSDYSGYQECPSLSLQENPQSQSVDDHTVPSASQQNSNNLDGVQLRLRLSATTQLSRHSHCEDEQAESSSQSESHSTHRHTPGMRESCPATCARTLPYVCHINENESTHAEQVPNSEYSNPEGDAGQQTSYSVCSVENLSELVKDMSLVDDTANPERNTCTAPVMATEQSHLSQCEEDVKVNMQDQISNSCDHRLNQLEVTTFKPPIASTPFRDPSSPMKLLQGDGNLRLQESPNICTRMSCSFSNNMQRTVTTTRFCDQGMSVLVKETPEHLWCSPKLPHIGLAHDRNSIKVSESIFDAGNAPNSNCSHNDNVVDENHSLAWQMCSDIGDVDMTTLNNFDDTDTTHNAMHGSPTATDESKSTCTCEHSAIIPPTQDSTHFSEGEWSVLAKQTPDDLWCSPVVKVVDNSL